MRRPSLRSLLLVPTLVTIVTGLIVFAVAVDVSERALRLSEIDAELSRAERVPLTAFIPGRDDGQAGTVLPPASALPDAGVPGDLPIQLAVTTDGTIVGGQGGANPFTAVELDRFAATSARSVTSVDGYRVLVSPSLGGVVRITGMSLDGYNAAIANLQRTLLLGGIVIVVLQGAVVWLLARRLARPIAAATAGVSRIADGALDTVITPAGGSREMVGLSADIGRMVDRLRAALIEREHSASDATRARDDMRRLLADVSHEIRTPLTALKGYSDLYAREMLREQGALDRAMSRVGEESIRLHELVDAMLQLARDGVPTESVVVEVDVAGIARNVVDDLRVAFPERGIEARLHGALDERVSGDPARIHQALLNLGANACRHTPVETPIEVVASVSTAPRGPAAPTDGETAGSLSVSFIDHGAGVETDEQEKIFLPFYRADPSRMRNHPDGAGLGLAVTLQIAVDTGGTVILHETPGGGATFELRFPLSG